MLPLDLGSSSALPYSTGYPTTDRRTMLCIVLGGGSAKTCRVYVGEPDSSHWRPLFERPTHCRLSDRPKPDADGGGTLARTPTHHWIGATVAAGIRLVLVTGRGAKSNCRRRLYVARIIIVTLWNHYIQPLLPKKCHSEVTRSYRVLMMDRAKPVCRY